ncbi:hypothetical protein [Pseudoduganella chitinolytica]|uniref:Uncharacterized protein n=1 Tax=Pseudoduganella chitinolytica TaxID=34070 RepID=A0ABY8BBR7_9BURK|nr:hypothetical protein [Pseudoduganella chitinolytica]WEF32212.1 hypothetical protein PX653_22770 [Pseudoduganella chitinolytica]
MAGSKVSRNGAPVAIRDMEAVAAAKSDVNNVAVFTKFIKKAEDTAQAAL